MNDGFKSFKRIMYQLYYVMSAKQRRKTLIVFFCTVFASGLELLGVSSIYPFLQLMLQPAELQSKWYIRWLYQFRPSRTLNDTLLLIGLLIIAVFFFKNIFMICISYIQNSFAARFQKELSVRMLELYLKRPYQYFLNVNSNLIYRGITSDINGVYQILINLFTLFSELLTVCVLGIFLLITDWSIALSAMLLAGVCFFIIIFSFKERMKKAGIDAQKAIALKSQYGFQAINGIKEITVLDRRESFVRRYSTAAELEQRSMVVNGFIGTCPDRILEGICIGGFMGIVCVKIATGIDLDSFIPVLGTFAMGAFRILPSISKISSRINFVIYYQPTLQNTYNNLKEVEAYEQYMIEYSMPLGIKYKNIQFINEIKIKNVNWRYQNTNSNVLNNISITIKKGEAVAFIGASGAGKTTLADIIMGLLKPQQGTVEMDGIDIFTIQRQWAKIIGYVPQAVFLIDDSVRNNVAFGLGQDEIVEDRVWKALEQAQLKEFVENLPYGLDTIVGERGIKFSGGQRQRIAIARALYEDPAIIVLDEATSSLDGETENAVMESIDALSGVKTLIIVAHRLATIRNCNRIYEVSSKGVTEKSKEEILLS